MQTHRYLPDVNRLSVLSATILLAYTMSRFIEFPSREVSFQAPGIFISYTYSITTLISVLAACLAAVGMQWLLSDHPSLAAAERKGAAHWISLMPHWLLPALTAWVIGIPLGNMENSPEWWMVFTMGGILLVLVCAAEYIALDPAGLWRPPAAMVLTALSFALFLVLAITLRTNGGRLYLALPMIFLTAGLVVLRTMNLQLNGRWAYAYALGISFAVCQVAIGMHYLPISPIRYGLFLLAPLYSLTNLVGSLEDGSSLRNSLQEPLIMAALIVILAVWFG